MKPVFCLTLQNMNILEQVFTKNIFRYSVVQTKTNSHGCKLKQITWFFLTGCHLVMGGCKVFYRSNIGRVNYHGITAIGRVYSWLKWIMNKWW